MPLVYWRKDPETKERYYYDTDDLNNKQYAEVCKLEKEMHKDKGMHMKDLETYMRDLSDDVTELIGNMSPEEKNMMKNKMQVLMQKIQ